MLTIASRENQTWVHILVAIRKDIAARQMHGFPHGGGTFFKLVVEIVNLFVKLI